jgi:hypothetical protein
MILAATIIAGLVISTLFAQLGTATFIPYNADNMTVAGVLATDSYVLYPYDASSLTWGFSKYGELINGAGLVGMSYKGMDVFANPHVLQKDWSQGWYIDIHYADLDNHYQRAWAFALFGDESPMGIDGGWQENVSSPLGPPYGGRETNVWATTDPINVLYDGPREFIAQCSNTLYALPDHNVTNSGLVKIILTFVFNKDSKEIVEFKDIKRLDQGKFGRDFQIEFSNRGEWDIGTTSSPPSNATIYNSAQLAAQGLYTPYGYNYHPYYSAAHPITGYYLAQIINQVGTYVGWVAYWPQPYGAIVMPTNFITRTQVLSSLCTVEKNVTWTQLQSPSYNSTLGGWPITFSAYGWLTSELYPIGGGTWDSTPMVFKNGVLLGAADFTWDPVDQIIILAAQPLSTDVFTIDYKHHQPAYNDGNGDFMGHWQSGAGTPYVIGEWDFKLTRDPVAQQFRAVAVYGLTDDHDGYNDPNSNNGVIDSEVKYQLNQVFNPMDLYNAVEKKAAEWVDYHTVTTGEYTAAQSGTDLIIPLTNNPVLYPSTWGQYNDESERVMFNGVLQYPLRAAGLGYGDSYELYVNSKTGLSSPGIGEITVFHKYVPAAGTVIKIIYTTDNQYTNTHNIILSSATLYLNATATSLNNTAITNPTWGYDHSSFDPDYLTAGHDFTITNLNVSITNATATTVGASCNLTGSFHWCASNIMVFKEYMANITPFDMPVMTNTVTQNNITISFSKFKMEYDIYPPEWESLEEDLDLNVTHVDLLVNYNITAVYNNATTNTYNATMQFTITHQTADLYTESMPGRYEYGIVGRNAASVDSAGLSLVSAAYKDKQVEYGWAGEDIMDPLIANQMPFVMSPVSAGDVWASYYYSGTDLRTGLKDDYCRAGYASSYTIPNQISRADLIGVGGPLANMLAYYGNDFASGFFGLNTPTQQFTPYATWQNAIVPLSCWNASHTGYTDNLTVGYAVVSVSQDWNGTTLLLIWGNWGRDTYYVTRWFQEDGIFEFQDPQFYGVTSVVVQINYENTTEGYKPTGFSIPEVLGTISERGIYYWGSLVKGGIHEDP